MISPVSLFSQPMSKKTYLAVDLGAGSGRVLAVTYDGARLALEEVHRFASAGIRLPTGWHWNIEQIFSEILTGLGEASRRYGSGIVSLGVDSWGVDYGLVDRNGRLLGLPWMYRDPRTDGAMERVETRLPQAERFARTGIKPAFYNTLYQLSTEATTYPDLLKNASRVLFIPDLIAFWLTGVQVNERTIASTSEMLRAGSPEWDLDLAGACGVPQHLLHPVVEPGTTIGGLLPELQSVIACGDLRVVAVAAHDTASAVVALPSVEKQPLFLSSGTWSLVGTELLRPFVSEDAMEAGFSNEHGVGGTTRLLKNITGMWLLQECQKRWKRDGLALGYGELVEAARAVEIDAWIDPDAPDFERPADMPEAIRQAVSKNGGRIPETPGEFTKAILQSLARKYQIVIERLLSLTGSAPEVLHVVGGGSQNRLLNQMTADACGLTVAAGPVEATSIGNVLVQMVAAGDLGSVQEGRELVRISFEPEVFERAR